MGKKERKEMILYFLNEYDLALPPKAIYRNMRHTRMATFSETSMTNYLNEMVDEGLLKRIDPNPYQEGEIVELDKNTRRAYYIITDKGIDRVTS